MDLTEIVELRLHACCSVSDKGGTCRSASFRSISLNTYPISVIFGFSKSFGLWHLPSTLYPSAGFVVRSQIVAEIGGYVPVMSSSSTTMSAQGDLPAASTVSFQAPESVTDA